MGGSNPAVQVFTAAEAKAKDRAQIENRVWDLDPLDAVRIWLGDFCRQPGHSRDQSHHKSTRAAGAGIRAGPGQLAENGIGRTGVSCAGG